MIKNLTVDCVVRASVHVTSVPCYLCSLPLEYSGKRRVRLIPGIFPLISTELSRDEIYSPLQKIL